MPTDQTITEVAYGGRKFRVAHRRWGTDRLVISQCFEQAQYDLPSGEQGHQAAQVYRDIVASGMKPLIVDCGAHIGSSVLWFTARYPEAQIIAVEPSPANFALLRRNCTGLDVDLRQAGIGPVDGVTWMSNPSDEWGCRTNDDDSGIAVDVVSVETLLRSRPASKYTPFLLKVDIEGAEKALFTGPANILNRFPLIFMEPHDWMLPGEGTSLEFFRFHSQAGREFAISHENVVSIARQEGSTRSRYPTSTIGPEKSEVPTAEKTMSSG